jgi:osmotically-inducible protein OsmY
MLNMKRVFSYILAGCLTAPIFVSQLAAQSPTQTTAPVKHSADDRIYDEVRRKLADDIDVKGAGIDVAVNNGAVTLSGKVHTEKGKEKAEKLAKKTKGVTGVQNNLTVLESEK